MLYCWQTIPFVSSQQNQLWNHIGVTPNKTVLIEPRSDNLRGIKGQPENQETVLAGPFIGRMLANSCYEDETAPREFLGQGSLPCCVGGFVGRLAEGVTGSQKRAAVDHLSPVSGEQVSTGLPHPQGERQLAKDAVLRLQVGLNSERVDGRR